MKATLPTCCTHYSLEKTSEIHAHTPCQPRVATSPVKSALYHILPDSMEDFTSGTMIKLTASNYVLWKTRMEDMLYCKDLYDPLENKGIIPITKTEDEWKKMNRKTIGQIRQWTDHSVFHHVAQETSAYSLWEKLETMYQPKNAWNKACLMRRLINLKLKNESSIAEHTSEFQSLVNQLATAKMDLDDETQALLLLSSLPDNWEMLVVSLSNSAPNDKLTMTIVKGALYNEEKRRKEMRAGQSRALVTENGRRKETQVEVEAKAEKEDQDQDPKA
ncbi:hypothetical protein F0562_015476 [Nyssa sinensis]|uniref:Retrotransposon Copia-like N-terminal domain-containing protein n=1 Tax=Nyssa sinensis TaxID=561372 RepID=A0A5J4ZKI6_9ASTE|nr:hypothetical protein F0562_015476 [Nyssa sinensis]